MRRSSCPPDGEQSTHAAWRGTPVLRAAGRAEQPAITKGGNAMLKRLAITTAAALLAALVLFGCNRSGDSPGPQGPAPVYPTTTLEVSVGDGTASAQSQRFVFVGTFADVTRITMDVAGEDKFGVLQNPLASIELTKGADGVWRSVIADLPIGPLLTFTAHGYDASDTEIFNGSTAQTLTGSGDLVTVAMDPVEDGVAIVFPIVEAITLPAEIVHDTSAQVAVDVRGNPSETLDFGFSSGGGTFAPPGGTLGLPSGGTGTFNTQYTAPSAVGTYNHAVRVTNAQGNAVETDFSTTVVYAVTNPDVRVSFAPVVSALLGKRNGSDVTWTATVSDDGPLAALSYAWSFAPASGSPAASFSVADANPGVLSGYDPTVNGEVTLTVTDGDGLVTSVSFTLVAGQFPDGVVQTPSPPPAASFAYFPANGADWNDYVRNDGSTALDATDVACDAAADGPRYSACLHAGEMRAIELTGETSCAGLTAVDALGAFDWQCVDDGGTIKMVSTGLKPGKHLSDLIDFGALAWKDNTITVSGGSFGSSAPAKWWSNPIVSANAGGTLSQPGTVYVVTAASLPAPVSIDADRAALVIAPGVTAQVAGSAQDAVRVELNRSFGWLEGAIDATGHNIGLQLFHAVFWRLRGVQISNGTGTYAGLYMVTTRKSRFEDVSISAHPYNGLQMYASSNGNTFRNLRIADSGSDGMYVRDSTGLQVKGLTLTDNAWSGLLLYNSTDALVEDVTVSGSGDDGLKAYTACDGFQVRNARLVDNGLTGASVDHCPGLRMSDVTANNNNSSGLQLSGINGGALQRITTFNNGFDGILLFSGAVNVSIAGVTAANNGRAGVETQSASGNNLFAGIASANNTQAGFLLSSGANTIVDTAAAHNGNYGYRLIGAGNYVSGLLKVGNNLFDCLNNAGSGLTNSCTNEVTSDSTLTSGISLATAFVAEVSADSVNAQGATPLQNYADITDWVAFETALRGWGLAGASPFPDSGNQGRCVAGTQCRIWDWAARSSDTVLRDVLSVPTGVDSLTHTWSAVDAAACAAIPGASWDGSACTSTVLRHAVEIGGDGIGNDNGLCESGETCLYTPNIGGYQGADNLVSAGAFVDGTLTGITLLRYGTNGVP